VPANTMLLNDDGKQFLERYGRAPKAGLYSFDKKGAHFFGLVNVMNSESRGAWDFGPRAAGMGWKTT